jgi:hypothetical protein
VQIPNYPPMSTPDLPPRLAGRDMLAPREIAELTGLSYHAVLRAIKRGDLAAVELVPGRLRVKVAEYERWCEPPAQAPVRASRERTRRPAGQGSFAAELRAM